MHAIPDRDAGRGPSQRVRAAMAGLLLVLALPASAAAHAELVTSTPDDGAVVAAPAEVVLTFDEAVVEGSSFAVLDATGSTVVTGLPDPADPTIMRAALPTLGAGAYEVQWTSVAEDADVERGTFRFTIAAPTPVPPTPVPPTPTPVPSDAPEATPTLSATVTLAPADSPAPSATGGSGSNSGTDVLLPILAVVVVVAVGLAAMLRRRGPG